MSKKHRRYKGNNRVNILGFDGDLCPRCNQKTKVFEHKTITSRHLSQPFYYSRWFYCINPECRTKQIMPDRFRVFRDQVDRDQQKRLELIKDQLDVPW